MTDLRHTKRAFTIPKNRVRRDKVMRHLVATIFQESSNAPYLNVFKNTFSSDFELVYDGPGQYRILSQFGEFTDGETTLMIGQSSSGLSESVAFINYVSDSEIEIRTRQFGVGEVDGVLVGQLLEIKVYTL